MASFLQFSGDKFWNFIETNLKTEIPKYCKNIFVVNGMDNAIALQELSEDTIIQQL